MSATGPDGSMDARGVTVLDDFTSEDHATIEEEQVVDRYLMGSLPREQAERFERHFLSCPRCLDRLELGEELLDGMRHAAAQDVEQAGVAAALLLALRRLGRWRVPVAALVAASLLLPAGLLFRQLQKMGGELEDLRVALRAPQVNLPLLTLSPQRGDPAGAEPSHRLRLPAEPGQVVLVLELDLPLGVAYRAVLSGASGEVRWRGGDLLADAAGNLVLSLPTDFFSPGDHLLRIEDPASGDPIAHFPLRVLPPR